MDSIGIATGFPNIYDPLILGKNLSCGEAVPKSMLMIDFV